MFVFYLRGLKLFFFKFDQMVKFVNNDKPLIYVQRNSPKYPVLKTKTFCMLLKEKFALKKKIIFDDH